jgi:CBS domain-containing protein
MATVQDILARKGNAVVTIPASTSVLDATHCMNQNKVGCLVVTQDSRIVGILSERDILIRVVAEQQPPARIPVEEVMTRDVLCCEPFTPIDEASRIMKDRRVRHLPVCNADGGLLGIISIGDLNAFHASDTETHLRYLTDYLYSSQT